MMEELIHDYIYFLEGQVLGFNPNFKGRNDLLKKFIEDFMNNKL